MAVAPASGTAAPRATTVGEIVASPRTYADKKVTVTGVMMPEWRLCAEPFGKSEGEGNSYGAQTCIDVSNFNREFTLKYEKYVGARVLIAGHYWHRCLEESRRAMPDILQEDCKNENLNGKIGPLRVTIVGYALLQGAANKNVPPDMTADLSRASVNVFAHSLASAIRRKDGNAIAAMFPLNKRGRYRVTLNDKRSRDYWIFMSSEHANLGRSAEDASEGYRVYGSLRWADFCFCRLDSCKGRWPVTAEEFDRPSSLGAPLVCYGASFSKGQWWLEPSWLE